MSAYDLVEEVKKNAGIESDNQIAVALGKERSTVSAWKRSLAKPDGEAVLKLCMLGNIDAKRALELMQGGYAKVSLLTVTAILTGAYVLASHRITYDLLYIIRIYLY